MVVFMKELSSACVETFFFYTFQFLGEIETDNLTVSNSEIIIFNFTFKNRDFMK